MHCTWVPEGESWGMNIKHDLRFPAQDGGAMCNPLVGSPPRACATSQRPSRPHSLFVHGDSTGPSATNRRTSNMITNKALFHRVAVQIKWMLCSARRAPCPPPPPCGRALTIHDLPPAQDMPVVRWFPLHMCRFASTNLKIANRRILFISNNCL